MFVSHWQVGSPKFGYARRRSADVPALRESLVVVRRQSRESKANRWRCLVVGIRFDLAWELLVLLNVLVFFSAMVALSLIFFEAGPEIADALRSDLCLR